MFRPNSLFYVDSYKLSHTPMLAPGTTRLYGTWIPRSLKHAPKGITKILSFGQQLTWKWIHDEFAENFFYSKETKAHRENNNVLGLAYYKEQAMEFIKDVSMHIGMEYDGTHFSELWDLGYLPIKVKALPEGTETLPNIPHMTFVNTVDGFAWLTLFLETIVSALAWKPMVSATIAKLYKKQALEWVKKTDEKNIGLVDYLCHDFSARGLSPHDMMASGLGHASSFRGSDTLIVIPAARYFYNEPENEVVINSVNASEHSVSTTKIFTVGESQMIADWLEIFPKGILSLVSDTFDLWKLITEYLPVHKDAIMNRDGKLVIRPDSGDPVDIICGLQPISEYEDMLNVTVESMPSGYWCKNRDNFYTENGKKVSQNEIKGVIELLWDIFGGTINEQGYKVLDPHIGAIYGDSITTERQLEIYKRLEAKGFAATNIVLGVGSYTYQYNTRDTLGLAAKGAWFEILENGIRTGYNIYKDPVTDDGSKKSLKGLQMVYQDTDGEIKVKGECTYPEERQGLLQVIYENGDFYNQTSLTEIRERINKLLS